MIPDDIAVFLRQVKEQFEYYENQHSKKNTIEAYQKQIVNRAFKLTASSLINKYVNVMNGDKAKIAQKWYDTH